MWFLRLSKIFGLFPIRTLKNGSLEFAPLSFTTLLAVACPLAYTAFTMCTLNSVLVHHRLSYVLTFLPPSFISLMSDYVIRICSFYWSKDFIKLVALIGQIKGEAAGIGKGLRWFCCAVAILITLISLIRNIGSMIVLFETVGANWYVLIVWAMWPATCGLLHDGAVACVFCFVVVFGKLVVSCYEGLCKEILEFCRRGSAFAVPATLVAKHKTAPWHTQVINGSPDEYVQKLVDRFVLVKLAFEVYSKIGGAFIFALVAGAATWLYNDLCTELFNQEIMSPFILAVMALHMVLDMVVLVTIAELGHHMTKHVRRVNT